MNISEIAIKRPSLIVVLFSILTLLGIYGYNQLSYELLPKFSAPVVAITTLYPGASPAEVENTVTKTIEDAVSSLENISSVRSTSRENASIVVVELEQGADIDKSLQDAQRKINAVVAFLPEDALAPSLNKFSIDELPVIQIAATADLSPTEFYDLIKDRVEPSLARAPGVAQVTLIGGEEREIRVNVNPEKLRQYRLSILQVSQALKAANLDFPTGKIKDEERQVLIRLSGKFTNLEEVRNLVISRNPQTGSPVFLREIAEVEDTQKEVEKVARLNGVNAVGISIQKQSDANGVSLSKAVREELTNLEKIYEDKNLKFNIASDASEFTIEAANSVIEDIALAVALVALVMLVFLHSLRNAFIVMLAIPASLVATFFAMYIFDFTMNLMTLLAISLVVGILVDDSIVVLENIYRHLEMGKDRRTAALDGRNEIGFTALSITLVDVVVFFPLALLDGLIANIMRQFALVVVFSTLMSLLVSFTLTPWLSSRLSKLTVVNRKSIGGAFIHAVETFIHGLGNSYGYALKWALGHKTVTLVGTLLLILASFALPAMGLIGTEFADPGDKGEFVLKVELPKDATIQNTNEAMQILETDLGNRPEVKKLYANIGTSSSAFGSLEGQNLGDIFVTLLPPQESGLETSLYARSLQLELQQKYPEYKIETGLLGLLGGADQLPIQIILSGADKDSLYLFADQVKAMISKIDGVVDADISVEQGNPEIDIRMNRERMSDLGLSLDIVGASLQAAFNGTEATKYRDGDNEYDVTVRLDQFNRRDISDIENLSFINNQGQAILLSQFAEISRAVGPTQLDRRNRIAAVTIGSNVLGRTSGSVGEDIKQAFTKMHIPAGVEISYDGDIKNQAEGFGSLGLALIASFILVYLIMVALYDSYVYPFVVIFSIPVALIGALLALALSMKSLSIFSILGFIMLLGLVSKNAILIVDFTNQLKREGKRTVEALVIAGKTRLRPILMTTIAMVIGMMPIALADGPASVWKNGLAWALIGGLTSSMLLTLLVVPAVYMSVDILGAIFSGDKEGRPRKHELDSIDIESIGLIELDEALGNGHARTEEAKAEGAVV